MVLNVIDQGAKWIIRRRPSLWTCECPGSSDLLVWAERRSVAETTRIPDRSRFVLCFCLCAAVRCWWGSLSRLGQYHVKLRRLRSVCSVLLMREAPIIYDPNWPVL